MADEPGSAAVPQPGQAIWKIPVLDPLDRERELMVVISNGRVVMLGPPGEAWTLPPESDQRFIEAIFEARAIANQMGPPPS